MSKTPISCCYSKFPLQTLNKPIQSKATTRKFRVSFTFLYLLSIICIRQIILWSRLTTEMGDICVPLKDYVQHTNPEQ
jgi:hypothetical protein